MHRCMLDSGAAMNAIPLHFMKEMGLEVTRPDGNVYGIDSRRVPSYGLIKKTLELICLHAQTFPL